MGDSGEHSKDRKKEKGKMGGGCIKDCKAKQNGKLGREEGCGQSPLE